MKINGIKQEAMPGYYIVGKDANRYSVQEGDATMFHIAPQPGQKIYSK